MARKYEFTRTLETTIVKALVFNKTTAEAETETLMVSGKYEIDDRKLAKRVEKLVEADDNYKFIQVADAEVKSALYGTTLDQFMKIAVQLDPQTRQPLAE